MTTLIPKTIPEILELARLLAASGLVSEEEIAEAGARAGRLGCTLPEAIQANVFARILAGAARGVDPATSMRLFGVFRGTIRAVREGTLALVQQSGLLAEIDERVVTFAGLQGLERIATGRGEDEYDEAALAAAREAWRAEANTEGKLRQLQRRGVERLRQLDLRGRTDGTGYLAAICAVRRGDTWHVMIRDIDHAQQHGLLDGSADGGWWQDRLEEALKYSARQPLLHEAFADVLAGLDVDDGARAEPAPAPSDAPDDAADDDEGEGLRSGVTAA